MNNKKIGVIFPGANYSADTLKKHCTKENIYLKLIEGVGHRLEVKGDMNKNIELLKDIVSTY